MPTHKPLSADDFPVNAHDDKVVEKDGTQIAKARNPDVAADIADRLNENQHKRDEDEWSA
jgi:hypothetical protein